MLFYEYKKKNTFSLIIYTAIYCCYCSRVVVVVGGIRARVHMHVFSFYENTSFFDSASKNHVCFWFPGVCVCVCVRAERRGFVQVLSARARHCTQPRTHHLGKQERKTNIFKPKQLLTMDV